MPTPARAVVTLSGGGLVLAEQGGTFDVGNVAGASFASIPFSSSDLGLGVHVVANLNNETYGNSSSWIGGDTNPYPLPFAGIAFDGFFTLQSIAFGRSNVTSGDPCAGGVCTDRNLGLYTLQYSTVPGVGSATPDADWTTIGTLNYISAGGANFTAPHLRHRYNFDPIADVTGVRLLVPTTGIGGGTAIDEIELYEMAGTIITPPPPPPPFAIAPAAGHNITWDGNDGDNFDPAPPPTGALVPNNLALATNSAIPISSSDLGPEIGVAFHRAVNLNDGIYGNSNSWIPGSNNPAGPFAGVALHGMFYVSQIAFGRDNGNGAFDDSVAGSDACGGQCDDRYLGLYTLQYTQLANPDKNTPQTGDPATGWADIGTVNYTSTVDLPPGGGFTGYLRHAFGVSADGAPLLASGVRMLVPAGTAIDEIEVYGSAVPEPSTFVLATLALGGVLVLRRRRR
ncbi:MAG: PEP-CTERM sorting domain-containing protein [Pirellulales bacterium]